MAASLPTPFGYQQFTGDGSKTDFTFSFDYLLREHVKVYLDKTEVVEGSDADQFQWEDTKKIKMGTAPTASQTLTIIRLTPEDKQQVPWNDGSYLVAEDLNTSDKQWLYLLEEHYDYIIRIIWGEPPVPGPGLPDDLFGLWNRLARNKDSNKGTSDEVAQTIDKTDQLKGDASSPQNGEDSYVLTLGAISERLDLIKGDGSSYPGTGNTGQLGKLRVNSSNKLFFWDQTLATPAWVEIIGGSAGPPGAAATIAVGTTTTLDAGKDATVSNSGTSSAAVFDFGIPKGADGTNGTDGTTPSVTVGTTTTGSAGTDAAVTNTGTAPDVVLNFTIPKGADGTGTGTVTEVKAGNGITVADASTTPTVAAQSGDNSITVDSDGIKVKVKSGGGITVDSEGLSASSSGGVPDVTTDGSFNRTQSGGTKSWTTAAPSDAQKNVQSDWDATTGDAFIQNKPTIPAAQIQSDWTQATASALDFIKNKPTIPAAQIQSDWDQTTDTALDFIKNKPIITSSPWTLDGTTIKPAIATNDVETTASLKTKQVWSDAVTLTGATVTPDFKDGNCFILSGAITTVNAPSNLKVGQTGKFYFLSGATVAGWNTNYKWPGGTAALAPTGLTIVPFYVATASIILMGASTEDIK